MPEFGSYLSALQAAGVRTGSARRFWGGVTERGEIVVTAWADLHDGQGRYKVWKPPTNHGGLKAAWDAGHVRPGTPVRVILLRAREELPIGKPRSVRDAAVLPTHWRIAALVRGEDWQALIEPA